MKLATSNRSLETAGMNLGVNFSIKMNGKSFRVLSSGVYSDKIGSIVRELSSNCYDSHVAAGKRDVPFEVYCPNNFDPFFAVKDFGTGLRYFAYTAKVVCELDGESTLYIPGDIRTDIRNINIMVLDETTTIPVSTILYDSSADQTIFRVPLTLPNGSSIKVEFDDALVLYSTYFDSTKEASNEFIGAFGLGSKTPFAYTDNFLVTNRYNGVERIYNILINESDIPQINLMGSTTTDECNGLEVKLAVNPADHSKFKDAIKTQLKFFNPAPTICNDAVDMPKIIKDGEHFILWENSENKSWDTKYTAAIGNNSYRFGSNIASVDSIFSRNIAIKIPVGAVMVTASRESMESGDDTRKVVEKYAKLAAHEYTKYILSTIDTTNMTGAEKAEFLNNNSDGIDLSSPDVIKLVGNPHYIYRSRGIHINVNTWCGQYNQLRFVNEPKRDSYGNIVSDSTGAPVMTERRIGGHSNDSSCVQWFDYIRSTGKTSKIENDVTVLPGDNLLVFVRDNDYAFLKKIDYYMDQNPTGHATKIYVARPIDTGSNHVSFDEAKVALSELGLDITYVNLSEIVVPKNSSTPTYVSKTAITKVWRTGDDPRHITADALSLWEENFTETLTKIDVSAGNVYAIESYRNDFVLKGMNYNDIKFLNLAVRNGMFKRDIVIHAVTTAKYEKFIEYGAKPISELITEVRDSIKIPVEYADHLVSLKIETAIQELSISRVLNRLTDIHVSKLSYRNPASAILRLRNLARKYIYDGDASLMEHLKVNGFEVPEPSTRIQKMLDLTNRMCENIKVDPSMQILTLIGHVNSSSIDIIVNYLNSNTGVKK